MTAENKILYESRYRLKSQSFLPMIATLFVIASGMAAIFLLDKILCRLAGCVIFSETFWEYTGQVDLQTPDGITYNIAVCVIHTLMVFLLIFLRPFYTSLRRTAFLNARGHITDSRSVLSCVLSHERFICSVHLGFNIALRMLSFLVLSLLPAIACLLIGNSQNNEYIWLIGIVLTILGFFGTALFGLRYCFADYFTFMGELNPDKALKKSVWLFKSNRKSVYRLFGSLWGYILLTLLILPAPWTLTYIEQTIAVCTKWKMKLIHNS
ncbi:MAG: hypothetical protein ACI4M3_00310 [Acutalibacteraceae bacterium]